MPKLVVPWCYSPAQGQFMEHSETWIVAVAQLFFLPQWALDSEMEEQVSLGSMRSVPVSSFE